MVDEILNPTPSPRLIRQSGDREVRNYTIMIRISSGFYQGEYKGNAFQVFRVGEKGEAINGLWIWHTGTEGGEDYFPSKRVAIEAFKDWIDRQSTKGH